MELEVQDQQEIVYGDESNDEWIMADTHVSLEEAV